MSVSSTSIEIDTTSEMKPYQTMRGHTGLVHGVARLPDGRRVITCSGDGSLRLWEQESGTQIGDEWRDDGGEEEVNSIALSPSGKTVASGSEGGTVRLWDIETRKVTAKWTGHTRDVRSMCWSADGERVASGSYDGTLRVWEVKSGETVLGPIETGYQDIDAVAYSPDTSKIATGGYKETAIKLWDARTGELLSTLKQDSWVLSLAWTSDQRKLIAGYGNGSITIFNTVTWQGITIQEDDRLKPITAISLFQNDRLLASGSYDKTARLWNLDTNLQIGSPLQHHNNVRATAFSTDGKFLVTASDDNNVYVWDTYTILQEAGLEDLSSVPNVTTGKSILDSNATRRPMKPKEIITVVPRGFFDSSTPSTDPIPSTVHTDPPPATPSTDPPPSPARSDAPPSTRVRRHTFASFTVSNARAFLGHVFPRFRRSRPNTTAIEPTELQQHSRSGNLSVHGPADVDVPTAQDNQSDAKRHPVHPPKSPPSSLDDMDHVRSSTIRLHPGPLPRLGARPVVGHFSTRFSRSQPNADASTELQQRPTRDVVPHHSPAIVEVPELRDKQALYVAPRPVRVNRRRKDTWLARFFAFICCAPMEERHGSH